MAVRPPSSESEVHQFAIHYALTWTFNRKEQLNALLDKCPKDFAVDISRILIDHIGVDLPDVLEVLKKYDQECMIQPNGRQQAASKEEVDESPRAQYLVTSPRIRSRPRVSWLTQIAQWPQ